MLEESRSSISLPNRTGKILNNSMRTSNNNNNYYNNGNNDNTGKSRGSFTLIFRY